MSSTDKPHVYGSADPENRQPPAEEGFRGERAPRQPADHDQIRPVEGAPGVRVQEESGVAFAEAEGAGKPANASSSGAALAEGAVDPENANRTRDAGPENIRDPSAEWDAVDEDSDESFPASDPPAR